MGSSGEAKGSFSMMTSRNAVALHIHALPEARGAQQHGIAIVAKPAQQLLARRLALHEQPVALARGAPQGAQAHGRLGQGAMTGEQYEGSAPGRIDQRQAGIQQRADKIRGGRLGQSRRQPQQTLAFKVKGTGNAHGLGFLQAQAGVK